jgi:hypothetical protein
MNPERNQEEEQFHTSLSHQLWETAMQVWIFINLMQIGWNSNKVQQELLSINHYPQEAETTLIFNNSKVK